MIFEPQPPGIRSRVLKMWQDACHAERPLPDRDVLAQLLCDGLEGLIDHATHHNALTCHHCNPDRRLREW